MKKSDILAAPFWFDFALAELGVREHATGHNARILEYHMATKLKAQSDEISWCSAFVNWVFQKAGIIGTQSAAARSWTTWGKEIPTPVIGCVVIFWRGTQNGWQGHVGFFCGINSDGDIVVLGGNQNNQVSILVYPKTQLLGYRLPA